MKATCKFCKRIWNISIFQSYHDYICPYCAVKREDAPNTTVGKPSKLKILERNQARF